MPVRRHGDPGDDLRPVGFGVFLHQDGVGAGRQRRPREDADRLARADRARKAMARGARADEPQPRAGRGEIGRADRVAVHGGQGGRRLQPEGRHVGGEGAAVGGAQADAFGRPAGADAREDARAGVGDAEQVRAHVDLSASRS